MKVNNGFWIIGMCLALLLFGLGYSEINEGITPSAPANNTWFNTTNITDMGFTFSNNNLTTIGNGHCNLTIRNWTDETNHSMVVVANVSGDDVGFGGDYTFVDADIVRTVLSDYNGTIIQGLNINWSVVCTNATVILDSPTRYFNVDTDLPTISSYDEPLNESNHTGLGSVVSDMAFNLTVYDVPDFLPTCSLFIDGTLDQTAELVNNTATQFHANVSDGVHAWQWRCVDNATNYAWTALQNFTYEGTPPVIVINSPVFGANISTTTPTINFTATDNFPNIGCNVTFAGNATNGLSHQIVSINTTSGNSTLATQPTAWEFLSSARVVANITCWDKVTGYFDAYRNNSASSAHVNFTIDIDPPRIIDAFVNWNLTSGDDLLAFLNFSAEETNTSIISCGARIWYQNGTIANVTGVMNGTAGTINHTVCEVSLTNTDITQDGQFTLEPWARDVAGNVNYSLFMNQTNWTQTTFYSGWNIIALTANLTLEKIGNFSESITQVSWFNNSWLHKNFSTWVKGLTDNGDIMRLNGDTIYVYLNTTSAVIQRPWVVDQDPLNMTLSHGWNMDMQFNQSGLTASQICFGNNVTVQDTGTSPSMKYVSKLAANESKFQTYRCGFTYQADIFIPRGTGYWLNVEFNTTMDKIRD